LAVRTCIRISVPKWGDWPPFFEPARRFKPIKLNAARFDSGWDRKRGAAVRLTAVLLREDDMTLERRVCENDRSAKTYAEAVTWLQRESAHLRKVARLLDTAGGRKRRPRKTRM
jgi:hypothetical protein